MAHEDYPELKIRQAKALERWQAAQLEYRQECAWHKRFLSEVMKGKKLEELTPEQSHVMLMGKARRSAASKKRLEEERIYQASLNPLVDSKVISSVLQEIDVLREKIIGIRPSEVQLGRSSLEYQEMVHNVREQANASQKVKESLETIKKAALAHMEGKTIDPIYLNEEPEEFYFERRPEGYKDATAPEGTYEPYIPSVELDPFGEPIDDSLMDTDPDPVSDAVSIAPEAPEPLKTQELEQPEQTEPEPSRRERVLSNPLWASIAQAASEFISPPKASPLEQEGNGMPKTYDEYVKERELAQTNTPQFEQNVETEPNPNPKG